MARSKDPDSAGSQFFICLADARFLDRQYTAFGKLSKGDDVLGKLGDTPTTRGGGGENSRPTQRVSVESIKIAPAAQMVPMEQLEAGWEYGAKQCAESHSEETRPTRPIRDESGAALPGVESRESKPSEAKKSDKGAGCCGLIVLAVIAWLLYWAFKGCSTEP
jgi:hypothetical protein